MPVDFAGMPCDYEKINELVNSEFIKTMFNAQTEIQKQLGRIMVLSDAAHSIGGWHKGQRVGALTDVSVISFHAVKNLTTAEGGCICLNLEGFDNDKIYTALCTSTLHGQNKDALAKTEPGNWKYDIVEAGYKYNMTDILSSIGRVELARYETETLPKRKAICEQYMDAFSRLSWAHLPIFVEYEKESSYHLFPLRILNITEMQRDEIIASISKKGISVNVHFIPIPMMSFYKNMGYSIDNYPQTRKNYETEISLPVYFDLKPEEVDLVIEMVCNSVKEIIG